jgi:hypothetical protein
VDALGLFVYVRPCGLKGELGLLSSSFLAVGVRRFFVARPKAPPPPPPQKKITKKKR